MAIDRPKPGWFAFKCAPRTPWVPSVIFSPCPLVWPDETDWPYVPQDWCYPCDRSPYPLAVKIGEQIHWRDALVLAVWQRGEAISAQSYAYLMSRREWCRRHAPDAPEARPAVIRKWNGRKWEIQ